MSQSAYIRLVDGSTASSVTLDDLHLFLKEYQEQLALTGQQLGWKYEEVGFPYTIQTKPEGEGKWFYLKGSEARYKFIVMGVGSRMEGETEQPFIQVVLPDDATFGDKSKANELCKHLSRRLKAELQLFNGRIMYYNPRK